MKGHQQHIILIRINRIDICHQCDLFQKCRKCCRLSGLLHGFLEGFCLGDQLIDIFDPRLSLLRFLCLQFLHITGKLNDLFQGFTDCIGLCFTFQSLDKGYKIIDLSCCPANGRYFLHHAESIVKAQVHHIRIVLDPADAGESDPSFWHI